MSNWTAIRDGLDLGLDLSRARDENRNNERKNALAAAENQRARQQQDFDNRLAVRKDTRDGLKLDQDARRADVQTGLDIAKIGQANQRLELDAQTEQRAGRNDAVERQYRRALTDSRVSDTQMQRIEARYKERRGKQDIAVQQSAAALQALGEGNLTAARQALADMGGMTGVNIAQFTPENLIKVQATVERLMDGTDPTEFNSPEVQETAIAILTPALEASGRDMSRYGIKGVRQEADGRLSIHMVDKQTGATVPPTAGASSDPDDPMGDMTVEEFVQMAMDYDETGRMILATNEDELGSALRQEILSNVPAENAANYALTGTMDGRTRPNTLNGLNRQSKEQREGFVKAYTSDFIDGTEQQIAQFIAARPDFDVESAPAQVEGISEIMRSDGMRLSEAVGEYERRVGEQLVIDKTTANIQEEFGGLDPDYIAQALAPVISGDKTTDQVRAELRAEVTTVRDKANAEEAYNNMDDRVRRVAVDSEVAKLRKRAPQADSDKLAEIAVQLMRGNISRFDAGVMASELERLGGLPSDGLTRQMY